MVTPAGVRRAPRPRLGYRLRARPSRRESPECVFECNESEENRPCVDGGSPTRETRTKHQPICRVPLASCEYHHGGRSKRHRHAHASQEPGTQSQRQVKKFGRWYSILCGVSSSLLLGCARWIVFPFLGDAVCQWSHALLRTTILFFSVSALPKIIVLVSQASSDLQLMPAPDMLPLLCHLG
jgi:hypothetical protein